MKAISLALHPQTSSLHTKYSNYKKVAMFCSKLHIYYRQFKNNICLFTYNRGSNKDNSDSTDEDIFDDVFSSDDSVLDENYEPNDSSSCSSDTRSSCAESSQRTVPQEPVNILELQDIQEDGQQEQSVENGKRKQILTACNSKCRKKYSEKINDEWRQTIFDKFSKMSFSDRQYFLEAYLLQEKKRFQSGSSKRQFTITYYLPSKENKSKELVCKTMFLHTLGRKTDGLVTNFFNREHANTGLVVTTDLRAKTVN